MSVLQRTHEFIQIDWKVDDVYNNVYDTSLYKSFKSPSFSFAETHWRMSLTDILFSRPETTNFILYRNQHRHCSMECTFGVKKLDGNTEILDKWIMRDDQQRTIQLLLKLPEVVRRKTEFSPRGVFTFTCTLKLVATQSTDPIMLEEPKPKKLRKLDTLSQNFKDMLANKLNCDTTLYVQEKEYQVHKAVLIARSKVFAAMFQHDTSEKRSRVVTIPDCDPESFKEFLEYLYCGKLDEVSTRSAFHLFKISEKYCVLDLKNFCCEILIDNLSVENWYEMMVLADTYGEEILYGATQGFFSKNINKIFQTAEWEELMKTNYILANKLLKALPSMKIVN